MNDGNTSMTKPISSRAIWTSRILWTAAVLFMLLDTGIKLMRDSHAVEGTTRLGYPDSTVQLLGIIEAVCLVLYLIPRTSILGMVLLTGYFGGAVATHVRLENPLFSHVLFSVYIALMMWGSLYLREPRLQELLPFRKQ